MKIVNDLILNSEAFRSLSSAMNDMLTTISNLVSSVKGLTKACQSLSLIVNDNKNDIDDLRALVVQALQNSEDNLIDKSVNKKNVN